MCLVTKQSEPLIAKEDIPIWKVLNQFADGLRAPIQGTFYILKKLYKTDLKYRIPGKISSGEFMDYKASTLYFGTRFGEENNNDRLLTVVSSGFHSTKNAERLLNWADENSYVIVKGYIPAGAEYFEDETGLIVSNQLVLTEIENE